VVFPTFFVDERVFPTWFFEVCLDDEANFSTSLDFFLDGETDFFDLGFDGNLGFFFSISSPFSAC